MTSCLEPTSSHLQNSGTHEQNHRWDTPTAVVALLDMELQLALFALELSEENTAFFSSSSSTQAMRCGGREGGEQQPWRTGEKAPAIRSHCSKVNTGSRPKRRVPRVWNTVASSRQSRERSRQELQSNRHGGVFWADYYYPRAPGIINTVNSM